MTAPPDASRDQSGLPESRSSDTVDGHLGRDLLNVQARERLMFIEGQFTMTGHDL